MILAACVNRDEPDAGLTISFSWMELEFGKQYVASDEVPMQDLLGSLESFCKVRLHGLELRLAFRDGSDVRGTIDRIDDGRVTLERADEKPDWNLFVRRGGCV